jgi:hypothetical protein
MIDDGQTHDFQKSGDGLLDAKLGDVSVRRQLLRLGREANAQMDRVLADATFTPEAVEEFHGRRAKNHSSGKAIFQTTFARSSKV